MRVQDSRFAGSTVCNLVNRFVRTTRHCMRSLSIPMRIPPSSSFQNSDPPILKVRTACSSRSKKSLTSVMPPSSHAFRDDSTAFS
ncbi:hypothetical protein CEP51_016824 [Fusarium floridanum]|uniref:Uncharacterized protein n=1 Tax=Fusarium floridanum TaxID=1325733 RepID=A0A428NEU8_9HYPO|nr:hypothetical protein CEP51_016824 [Fusarium floridanum]